MKVREFLQANGLKQRELAHYLGVTEAAISNVTKGKSDFSEENLIKILKNKQGWDTSMLTSNQPEVPAEEKPTSENSLLEYLQRKIEKLEREKEELLPWDFIDVGVTREFLWREYERALDEKVTPNCREKCAGCGSRVFGGGVCYEG
jgi:transcriptional regulator with XRE-family HTH domain